VSLGIALTQPSHDAEGLVPFLHTSETAEAETLQVDWKYGQIVGTPSRSPQIKVTDHKPKVYIMFSVKDTGRGLSSAERDLLFARFSQASPRTHIDYGNQSTFCSGFIMGTDCDITGGSGLGLFISKRLTEMHGGQIGFTSRRGVGSTFAFYVKSRKSTVPRRQSEDSTAAVRTSIRRQASALTIQTRDKKDKTPESTTENTTQPTDLHILVVEDNLVNQRVLAKQLRTIGMKVTVANHGGEALEHLRTTQYCVTHGKPLSIVLMDWEMPVKFALPSQ
jgi:CheY-like chemotaxis protein